MTGLVLNLAAAVLILERHFVLGALAFIVGSIMDTLDGRYSRMSGKGTLFGAFLDSTLDRIEEGVVLAAVCWHFADSGDDVAAAACAARRARLADGQLHARPGRGARGRVQGRDRDAPGPRRDPLGRPAVRRGRADQRRRPAAGGDLPDGRPDHVHRRPAGLARARPAERSSAERLASARPPGACNQSAASGVIAVRPAPASGSPLSRSRTTAARAIPTDPAFATHTRRLSLSHDTTTDSHQRQRGEPGRSDDGKVRVAIVGVGNCANSFIQGVQYYKDADPNESVPGPDARRPRRLPRPRHRVHRPPSTSTPRRSARTSPRRSGRVRTTRSSSPRSRTWASRSIAA